jgi:hypothetical protein
MLPIIIGKRQSFLQTITESTGVEVPKILEDGIVVFGTAETIENALKIIEKKHSEVGGLPR